MWEFTLFVFGWDEKVLSVELIRSANAMAARAVADAICETQGDAAGWQLWHEGRKVLATFPQARAAYAPLELIAGGLAEAV